MGDNNINLNEYFSDDTVYNVPDRPTIKVTVEEEQTVYVYEEVTTPITREVTREVTKKVDKIIGERVVDTIPIVKGLQGDFVLKEKTLGDIPQFNNSSNTPQTITITQGNGKSASVTLYKTDTLDDVAKKKSTMQFRTHSVRGNIPITTANSVL